MNANISQQIEGAIEELKRQRDALEAKISADESERAELDQYMTEVRQKSEELKAAVIESNHKLELLVSTITETEDGYGKLLTAGKTLMEIVTKNMEQNTEKID